MEFVTRFAPSPSGLLHRGHAFSALTARRAAQEANGRFILRIEDIDQGRCKPEFEQAIYDDLAWLGLDWETPVRRQSDHFDDYRAALDRLRERALLYRCFKTRREILDEIGRAPHGPGEGADGVPYRGAPLPAAEEAVLIEAGRSFAWRLSLDAARDALGVQFDTLTFVEEGEGPDGQTGIMPVRADSGGDVVLARKDAGVAYHLAVVVDDALQGVTHIIRGADLQAAAHVQRLLQALLDLPEPIYRHHRLLTDADGKRFAKRDRAETLADLRARGMSAETLRAELGFDKDPA